MRSLFGAVLLLVLSDAIASGDEPSLVFTSGESQVALIELYTSEGCSSCPPADRWLSGLARDPELWRDYLPVAFHVDYWDYIGWPDRFARTEFSDRQRRYAREGGVHTVYTPGLFLNGSEWREWRRLERPDVDRSAAGALAVELTGENLAIAFNGDGFPGYGELTISVALIGMGLSSEVNAGENRGRVLRHDFVVLALSGKALDRHGHRYTATLAVPASDVDAPRYALAAWVSPAGRQAPLQATGGWLPEVESVAGRR